MTKSKASLLHPSVNTARQSQGAHRLPPLPRSDQGQPIHSVDPGCN